VREFGVNKEAVLQDQKQQEDLFYRCFPAQVEQGPQKAATYKWLLTRCADGSEKTAPRELIQLLNCLLEQETKRLEQGGPPAPDDKLFDRSVFKLALPTVRDNRRHGQGAIDGPVSIACQHFRNQETTNNHDPIRCAIGRYDQRDCRKHWRCKPSVRERRAEMR
jgi:hypothetical protein